MGEPAAAESSLRQGRGSSLKRASKIQFRTSSSSTQAPRTTTFCDPIESSTAASSIRSSFSNSNCSSKRNQKLPSRVIKPVANMSEPTPVFDPPVLENGTSAVEGEGSAAPTTDNGAPKENNGQDVTMAGLEDSGVKAAKTGADPAVSDTICYACNHCDIHLARIHHHKHNSLSPQKSLWPLAGLVSSPCKSLLNRAEPPLSSHKPPPSTSFPPS